MANPQKKLIFQVSMNGSNPRDVSTCQAMRLDFPKSYLFHILGKITLLGLCFVMLPYSSHHLREMVTKL